MDFKSEAGTVLYLDFSWVAKFFNGGAEEALTAFDKALSLLDTVTRKGDVDPSSFLRLIEAETLFRSAYGMIVRALPRERCDIRHHSDCKRVRDVPIYKGDVLP